jgi:heat shock protein HslJ
MKEKIARIVLPSILVALLSVVGCAQEPPEEPTWPPLEGTSWYLEELGPTGNVRPALATTEVTLSFTEGSKLAGSAGCNLYFGQYSSGEDGTFAVSGLGSTKMFCNQPGVMQQEQDLLNGLQSAERYEVSGGLLHITGDGMELVFSPA